MNNPMPYTITDRSVVLMIDGKTYTVSSGDDRYGEVRRAIREQNFDVIPQLLDLKGTLVSDSNGGLYLSNGMLHCDKYPVPSLLASRIVKSFKEGFSVEPLSKFLENLMENPSENARRELYGFIEACELPITADGHFLAYKMVRTDFMDIYTGRMDNSVGRIVEMPRENVDSNRNQTCSSGLHFCSEGYLGHYGTESSSQVVIVKVNPRDVVSIPVDYNNAKGRACRYEIVDAIPWNTKITPLFTDEYSDVEDDDWVPEDESDWDDEEFTSFDFDAPSGDLFETNGHRWSVYTAEGDLEMSYDSREDARWYCRRNNNSCFIWDNKLECVERGNPPYPEWTPDADATQPNPGAKLNATVVAEIRHRLDSYDYDSFAALAREYGVSDRTIRRIRDRESWVGVY